MSDVTVGRYIGIDGCFSGPFSGRAEVVLASDYDALAADLREWKDNCERLREIVSAHEPSMKAALAETAELSAALDAVIAERDAAYGQVDALKQQRSDLIAATSARVAELERAIKPLADLPLEEFGWGDRRPDQPITGWNKHTLYVRDVLAARAALADSGKHSD